MYVNSDQQNPEFHSNKSTHYTKIRQNQPSKPDLVQQLITSKHDLMRQTADLKKKYGIP